MVTHYKMWRPCIGSGTSVDGKQFCRNMSTWDLVFKPSSKQTCLACEDGSPIELMVCEINHLEHNFINYNDDVNMRY